MLYKNELLMLTWQTNLGLAFDSASLELQREFTTPMTDGWGLTLAPGDKFIGTDSTAILYTLKMDADGNLEETSRSTIHDAEKEVKWLNEIEWVEHDGVGEVRVIGTMCPQKHVRTKSVCWCHADLGNDLANRMHGACLTGNGGSARLD